MSSTSDKHKTIASKSSLEIISELFSTFNAEPPIIVKKERYEDTSKKHKRSKKKHKHKKHKKKSKKHKRSCTSSASSDSNTSGVDLTEILLKRDSSVKIEPTDINNKTDPEIPKQESAKNTKIGKLNSQSESSSSDSDDASAIKEAKFSSIFHVALQTLKEREKLKQEQLRHKRKHLDSDVAIDKKRKIESTPSKSNASSVSLLTKAVISEPKVHESEPKNLKGDSKDPKIEPKQSQIINENLSKTDALCSSDKIENKSCGYKLSRDKSDQQSNKSSKKSNSSYSKLHDKNESPSKRKISPIIFKSEDISNNSKNRESSKRREAESCQSRVRARDKDQDKEKPKDSYHRDDKTSLHKHKDTDYKRRQSDKHSNGNEFYRTKDESRSSRKRSRSGNRIADTVRTAGFSQGNLVSTRLGNPFYARPPGNIGFSNNSRSPPSIRLSGKEDRWSIRERFRRQTSSSTSNITIDKKKLLEIARKNAVQMIKSGSLPEALKLGAQAQEKVLAAIRSGGKTVDELTDFCRTLSCKEEMGELSSLSDGEQKSDAPESDTEQPFHHPFQLRERPQSITMNIKNSVPLPIKSTTERATELRLQFPVSSGQLHRKTESEWTPVEPLVPPLVEQPQPKAQPKKTDVAAAIPKGTALPTPSISIHAPVPPIIPLVPLPIPMVHSTSILHQPSSSVPVPVPAVIPTQQTAPRIVAPLMAPPLPPLPPMLPPPSPPPGLMYLGLDQPLLMPPQPLTVPPQPPIPGAPESFPQMMPHGPQVFPTSEQIAEQEKVDVAAIVAQRLTAMRKLQENPNDVQAISEIYKAQKEMNFWAECKQQIGQFTGSTGAQIMSQAELNSGYQAWARRDQLQTAAPVTGGMGMHLLQKMGWRPGEGLGKEKTGTLEPLLLEVKLDKKGVVAKEEIKGGRGSGRGNITAKNAPSTVKQVVKVLQGKHPVSLLSEYASKKRLGPPDYSLCFECGPDHKKNFVFKVVLNGVEYKPNVACGNKKEAKALSATVCLQQIGMLPHVPTTQQGPM